MSEQQQQEAGQEGAPQFTPEEQAAIEKGQQGLSPVDPNVVPPSGPQRPEWVPEQFWKDGQVDSEGLARSYAELRSKMDGKPAGTTPANETGAKPAAEGQRADGKIEKAEEGEGKEGEGQPAPLTAAMEAASAEWAESQEVSEDTRAALEAAGIPAPILDLYLEGLKAQTEKVVGEIHTIAGGEEAYKAMTSWAARSLSAEQIEAFNSALDNPAAREQAILGLQAQFQKANPTEGKLVIPTDGSAASGDVFASKDELVAAQRDPKYATDPVYRQSVMDKLARSQRGGFSLVDRPMFERTVISN